MFVTFEGIEGSGKSTQAALLGEALRGRGLRVLSVREPGGTPLGEALRAVLLDPRSTGMDGCAEMLIYLAARAQLVRSVIRPALDRGEIVLCDRYGDSTVAYQGGGRGLGTTFVRGWHRAAAGGLEPDLTFLLDLDPEQGLGRARSRIAMDGSASREGRFEGEPLEFHARVRETFLAIAGEEPARFRRIDASVPREEAARRILAWFDSARQERGR